MCGPAFEYTKEDYLNDASPEEWAEWESKAAELELTLDYYIQEFVWQLDKWHTPPCGLIREGLC